MKQSWRSYALILILFLACRGAIYSQTSDPSQGNLVHFGDLVDVDVVGSFEFDWRGSLTPEGFLDGYDKIEEQIYALCKTEDALAADIQKELARVLRDPRVTVRIIDRSNRALAYIDGAVRTPQRFQIQRKVFLNELLIVSGGITDNAGGEIRIFRPQNLSCDARPATDAGDFVKASRGNEPQTSFIKISDLLAGKKEANPEILSGDIVTVVEAFPIYVIGGVNTPKQISARSQTTLSRAVASAGGVAKNGIETKVAIYRREGTGSRVIEADLVKIRAGTSEDPVLKPMDIVEVGQKGRERSRRPPVIDRSVSGQGRLSKLPLRIID